MDEKKKDSRYGYMKQYRENKLKRVPLDIKIEDYEILQAAAEKAGESVNGYIKKAIAERIERQQNTTDKK